MAEETLKEILEQTKKEARFSRIIALLMLCIVILLVIVLLVVVPRVLSMITEIERTAQDARTVVTQAGDMLTELETTMEGVGEMTDSITKTGNAMFEGIGKVDFDALSKAIYDLEDAVEPLAGLSRALSGR